MGRNLKKKYTGYKVIIVILLILLIGEIFFLAYSILKDKAGAGSNAHVAEDASEWDDGIEQESGQIEGRILVPGYSGAKMKTGDTVLKLRIGNPKENTCYLKATLQLEDGTILYESDLLEPGTGYDEVKLNKTLEPGEYQAFVHYQGYAMDEGQEKLNGCDSAFVLKVTE